MTQSGVLWDWEKVRAWERESVFNSCPTRSHPHVMPLPTVSSVVLTNEVTVFSHESKVCLPPQNLRCDLRLYPCNIDWVMKMYSQQIWLFFHRPSNKISDLRSVEMPPVHSSTQFQHLIIFSAAVACRFFTYHLGCCCFFVHPHKFHF